MYAASSAPQEMMAHVVQPTAHPQRIALHNEVHARPPDAMTGPLTHSHLVMFAGPGEKEASRLHLATLLRDHHLPPPEDGNTHMRCDVAGFRLKWELHTEFVSWTFSRPFKAESFNAENPLTAIDVLPQEWLASLPGKCLAAKHLWIIPGHDLPPEILMSRFLNEETLVGSRVSGGFAAVYTDFALHRDGYSRTFVVADKLPPRRLGRLVQRLLEIDTYRMCALLGVPKARESSSILSVAETELADLARAIRAAGRHEEPRLLDRLTRLAGEVESQYAATHSRFSASAAYFQLIDQRLKEIGEIRIPGLQTLGEFIDRRLSPARDTCAWAVRRQDALSQRVSRISNLLRTRVEIEQQLSSQALLSAMNTRQHHQLKLQATVEGLSVAAITYYVVGLISYVAKGASEFGWPVSSEVTAAFAIPIVAVFGWTSLRRVHARLWKDASNRESAPSS
jgi:uncharacterized membrane-anchored protein